MSSAMNRIKLTSICIILIQSFNVIGKIDMQVEQFNSLSLKTGGSIELRQSDSPRVELEVTKGDADSLEVVVENNRLEIRGERKKGFFNRSRKPLEVEGTVYYQHLENVNAVGSGTITAEVLQSPSLVLSVTGSGDIAIGTVESEQAKMGVTGSGDFRISSLESEVTGLKVTGSGDIAIESLASVTLEAMIRGSGDISVSSGETTNQTVKIVGSGDYRAGSLTSKFSTVRVQGSGNIEINASESLDGGLQGPGDVHYEGDPDVNIKIQGSGSVNKR